MFRHLPGFLRTAIGMIAIALNTVFWTIPLFTVTAIKLLTPTPEGRSKRSAGAAALAQNWIGVNNWLIQNLQRVEWVITGVEGLSTQQWYLVLSNHLSGLDIPVLQRVFHRRIPFMRFFLKKNLIWTPILGQAWWALDFPFMSRHSAEAVACNPSLRMQDVEATRVACEKFKHLPTAILNYVEGTRFTLAKHDAQGSEYRNLLKPKAGGIAFALEAMGSRFTALLDVTIFYPDGDLGIGDLLRGRVRKVIVHVQQRPIPSEFMEGDYMGDAEHRARFRAWLAEMWAEKDALIDQLREQYGRGAMKVGAVAAPAA